MSIKSGIKFDDEIIADFLEKYDTWQDKYNKKHFKQVEEKLDEFLAKYPLSRIKTMDIDDYVVGKGMNSFCWWVENKLDELGDIRPRMLTSYQKFGIDYDKKNHRYRFCSKTAQRNRFGSDSDEIFSNIRKELITLITASIDGDYDVVAKSKLNKLFCNKISYLYNRNAFLPIYSDTDLNIILTALKIPFNFNEDRAFKRKILFQFYKALNRDDITPLLFMVFIYNKAGYRNYLRSDESKSLNSKIKAKDYKLIDISETSEIRVSQTSDKFGLIDVENPETLMSKKLTGKKGEEIVKNYLLAHKKELGISKIYFAFEENDYAHYDISYITSDGKTIYIEVKATKANRNNVVNFEMSDAEYKFLNENQNNYYVFYVNNVLNGDTIYRIPASKIIAKPSKYKASFRFDLD